MGLFDGLIGSVISSVVGGALGGAGQGGGGQGGTQGGAAGGGALGSILAQLAGGNQVQGTNMLGAVLSMVQQHGGLDGVLGQLRQAGLGAHADSWVGTGANQAPDANQMASALAPGVGHIAEQLGVSRGQASDILAKLLPEVINQFTPQGGVPSNGGGLLAQAMAALQAARG